MDDPSVSADATDATPAAVPLAARIAGRLRAVHPAAWCVAVGWVVFAWLFGALGVRHHRNFGTWAFDMGIYDQALWLVSRGKSWNTVRGLDVWGHHVNLIAYVFAPFYWLGAGPSFLYVAQAIVLGAGAIPTYLIARRRLGSPWFALAFAVAFLMYAPLQWIANANFHPEALVITPFLFAWYFARERRWRWCWVALAFALSTREDAAPAVFLLGLVVWWLNRQDDRHDADGTVSDSDRRMGLVIASAGLVWYLVTVRLVIPAFNRGHQPYYVQWFFGSYGSSMPEVIGEMLARPDRVVSDATQPDRLRFYRDLLLPVGGLPFGGLLQLVMALPQTLANVLGSSPYARMIRYQYTALQVAPIMIAAIEGGRVAMRFRVGRAALVPWLLVCAYVTNVAWSPSPLAPHYDWAWSTSEPRHAVMREAVDMIPDGASVSATYLLLPHLSQREQIYNWPNPWIASYWGDDDDYRLPDPTTIEYVVLDARHVGEAEQDLLESLVGPDGEYDVLLDRDGIVVGRRASFSAGRARDGQGARR